VKAKKKQQKILFIFLIIYYPPSSATFVYAMHMDYLRKRTVPFPIRITSIQFRAQAKAVDQQHGG
jgi:hypothetical protein